MTLASQNENRTDVNSGSSVTNQMKNTTCAYCGVGCGVDVEIEVDIHTKETVLSSLRGTPEHPANYGRLCVKGNKLLETNGLDGRLLSPQVNGKNVDWPEAVSTVASKFKNLIAKHGPDSVAFYVSGQLLTEDYYVANKLMKGYIGSGNIDTNSRMCMSSAVSGYKRAFGSDTVPCSYEDLEQTDLLVLIGSNAAWTHPVLFQRMERAKQLNPDLNVVFIDPRKTASCELADLHLPIKPGTDVALFNGLLNYLRLNNGLDQQYIAKHTQGIDAAQDAAQKWDLEAVSRCCDIDKELLVIFYQYFTNADRAVSFFSMGVNQSSSGVDKVNSIINCHLGTGKIGRPGCGPFSITGQPNAMGGREVGGLANMLAAHMDIENAVHQELVKRFWHSPNIANKPGYKAVDLFDQIDKGNIKAVWIMATNPLVSLPNRNKIEAALKKCEMVVVSDCVESNDTLDYAHVKFPASGWSEKDGTVTNSERRISRQRCLMPPAGNAKHDWQIICDIARAMGFGEGFDYQNPAEIFAEHASLSGFENQGTRDFDLSGLANITRSGYEQLKPIQWPVNSNNPLGTKRMFVDGKYYTQSGKANIIPLIVRPPEQLTSECFPFVLNTGRVRDQWHTMTRTGKAPTLTKHVDQAFLALHPDDAKTKSINEGDLIALTSSVSPSHKEGAPAQVILSAKIDPQLRKGELFAPIHWSKSCSSSASIAPLFTDARDPISGQPELKHAAVAIEKQIFAYHGQVFSRQELSANLLNQKLDYWIKTPILGGYMYRFASQHDKVDMYGWLQLNLPLNGEWLSAGSDNNSYFAALRAHKLTLVVFFSNDYSEIESNWIETLFEQESLDRDQISALLRAQPDERFMQGRTVCSCFSVGEKTIIKAIEKGYQTVSALGDKLKCGTNCGSCKSELSQLIKLRSNQFCQTEQLITLEAV